MNIAFNDIAEFVLIDEMTSEKNFPSIHFFSGVILKFLCFKRFRL